MLPVPNIQTLQTILIEAAQSQLPDDSHNIRCQAKADGSLVTQIDANLQNEITQKLASYWPEIALLGEEMSHQQQMSMLAYSEQGLWVLDPLDGTTNFTTGFPVYGLSLAYVRNGITELAVIYDPNRQECFSAELGKGAFLNGQAITLNTVTTLQECVANIDYKRLTEALSSRLVSCPPYRSQRNIGSCVLEWCWLAIGRIQLYLHGGQQLWDHAAGRLILSEAGGVASRIGGNEICSDNLIKQSAVAASNPELFDQWLDWVQQQQN